MQYMNTFLKASSIAFLISVASFSYNESVLGMDAWEEDDDTQAHRGASREPSVAALPGESDEAFALRLFSEMNVAEPVASREPVRDVRERGDVVAEAAGRGAPPTYEEATRGQRVSGVVPQVHTEERVWPKNDVFSTNVFSMRTITPRFREFIIGRIDAILKDFIEQDTGVFAVARQLRKVEEDAGSTSHEVRTSAASLYASIVEEMGGDQALLAQMNEYFVSVAVPHVARVLLEEGKGPGVPEASLFILKDFMTRGEMPINPYAFAELFTEARLSEDSAYNHAREVQGVEEILLGE